MKPCHVVLIILLGALALLYRAGVPGLLLWCAGVVVTLLLAECDRST